MTGDAELANARAFWLGYGIEYRDDAAVALYRSGVRSPSLNGILRVSDDGSTQGRTNLEFQRTGDITRFAGSVDGRIVATVSLFLEQGVAGFYSAS